MEEEEEHGGCGLMEMASCGRDIWRLHRVCSDAYKLCSAILVVALRCHRDVVELEAQVSRHSLCFLR
jgi:hypothetical protein